MLLSPFRCGLSLWVLGFRGHLCVHFRCSPMTRSPPKRWLCRSASFASFPPRMRSKLQGPDSCPGRSHLLLNTPALSWTHTEIPVSRNYAARGLRSGRAMARTGLRMMPTFPSSPLKFRTAGFPQYGFKAGFQRAPSREWRPRVTPSRFASFLRARRLQHCILRTVSETLCAQPPPCERSHRSTPGVLTPVRVILSRSICA